MKALIALNRAIPGNYSFVCPVAPLCLNPINRAGYTSVVSPSILRGLKGKTLIDVNGVIDLKTGTFKEVTKDVDSSQAVSESFEEAELPTEAPVEEVSEESEPNAEEKKSKPKQTKKTAK